MVYPLIIGLVALLAFTGSILSNAAYSDSTIIWKSPSPSNDHDQKVRQLSEQIRSRPSGSRIVLQRSPAVSHGVRPHSYKRDCFQLDISSYNQPLSIQSIPASDMPSDWHDYINFDRDRCIVVEAQAMLDMEGLVDYLLPFGLMPAVVPEFKGITVGRMTPLRSML